MIFDHLWLIAVAGGAAALGAALAFGILRNRKLTPAEHRQQDRKVRDLYNKDDLAKTESRQG